MTEQQFQREMDRRLRELENRMTLSEAQISAVSESIRNQISSQIALVNAQLSTIKEDLAEQRDARKWQMRMLAGVIVAQLADFINLTGGAP